MRQVTPVETSVLELRLMTNKWVYFILQDQSGFNTPHPIHLHGHDFLILGAGEGTFKDSNYTLKTNNPPRRDTAILNGTSWLAIAFKTDNPG
jgi:FtsP/CotA-like multicopper oxidase with cupredoxin domain